MGHLGVIITLEITLLIINRHNKNFYKKGFLSVIAPIEI